MTGTSNAARLASSAGSPFKSSARRRSRTASPVHYGSQLLVEVINYNASRRHERMSTAELIRLPSPPPTPSSSPVVPTATLPPPPTPLMSFVPSPVDAAPSARGASGDVRIHHAPECAAASGGARRSESWASIDGYDVPLVRRRNTNVVKRYPLELQKAIRDVQFIQNHIKRADQYDEVGPICSTLYAGAGAIPVAPVLCVHCANDVIKRRRDYWATPRRAVLTSDLSAPPTRKVERCGRLMIAARERPISGAKIKAILRSRQAVRIAVADARLASIDRLSARLGNIRAQYSICKRGPALATKEAPGFTSGFPLVCNRCARETSLLLKARSHYDASAAAHEPVPRRA